MTLMRHRAACIAGPAGTRFRIPGTFLWAVCLASVLAGGLGPLGVRGARAAEGASPSMGRSVQAVDLRAFREHQRAERESLEGLHKERRDAEADQPPSGQAPARQAMAAPSVAPAPKAAKKIRPKLSTKKSSGPWTIAMAPSAFPKGSLDRARDQFHHFTGRWLERIRDNMRFSERKAQVVRSAGAFLAKYSRLESGSRQMEVKATDSPGCPFVGVLKYLEHQYEARGATADQALAGPFQRVKTVRVTEIFRYSGDAWVH